MPHDNIFPRIQACIVDSLKIEPGRVTQETRQEDLEEWDSIGHLTIVLSVEAEFDASFQMEDIPGMTSVAILTQHVEASGSV
ncbi:MAG: acyl carrier protein [Fimbriimonas sp.]|nr:acyl carrier protein [Fimbriimonas sp.]